MLLRLTQLGLLLIIGMFLTACAPQNSGKVPPKIINGEIDLTGWNFEKDGPVKLDGEWLFAWKNFVQPADWPQLKAQIAEHAVVPGAWPQSIDYQSSTGYASYVVKINGLDDKANGIYLTGFNSAVTVFAVSETGAIYNTISVGKPSETVSTEVPINLAPALLRVQPGSEGKNAKKSLLLIIHLSSHSYNGGIWNKVLLGPHEQLASEHASTVQTASFMTGILFIMGIYHLILFFQRRKDKPSLFFGLFCLSLAMRLFSMGVAQTSGLLVGSQGWSHLLLLEYLSMPCFVVFCSYFVYSVVEGSFFRLLSRFLLVTGIPLGLFAVFAQPMLKAQYLIMFQAHILFVIAFSLGGLLYLSLQNNKIAWFLFTSFFIVFLGAVNDILYVNQFINSGFIGPYTTITVILLQSGLISFQNASAHKKADFLSGKLSEAVQIKTEQYRVEKEKAELALIQLKQSQEELSLAERKAATSRIAANLAHNVNNPLNYISAGTAINLKALARMTEALDFVAEEDPDAQEFVNYMTYEITKLQNSIQQQQVGSEKITELVKEMRSISGIDGYPEEKIWLRTLLASEIKKTRELLHIAKEDDNVTLVCADDCLVRMNRAILSQAIRSCLAECFLYAAPATKITIVCNTREHGGEFNLLEIEIKGHLPSDYDYDQAFLLSKKEEDKNTASAGLSLAYEALKAINGRLSLEAGSPSTFRIEYQELYTLQTAKKREKNEV